MTADLAYLTIAEAGARFRQRTLSPVELTRAVLDRIQATDDRVHSYMTVLAESAMAEADAAERELFNGNDRGPLHGIPLALKDLYATAGIPTTASSRLLKDSVPDEDATTVKLLRRAGMVHLGKLVMHEFAIGPATLDDWVPAARNPWNVEHMPGGSSSGSGSAVAAGQCLGALGSDTAGSIRIPSAYCGITGLKPTYGRVSRAGVIPLAWSLDHAGPMARTAEDCAILLQAIAGHDPSDTASNPAPVGDYLTGLSQGIAGLRVGVCRRYFFDSPEIEPGVADAVERGLAELRALGATVVEVDIPHIAHARYANTVIMFAEAYAYHEESLQQQGDMFGPVRLRFIQGGLFRASDYIQAQRTRSLVRDELAAAMRDADVLVMPTMPRAAPAFTADANMMARDPSFVAPFNLSGLPALSVPCGFSAAGLPIGMQIAGHALDEATVLRVGHAYQQATDWHLRRPEI